MPLRTWCLLHCPFRFLVAPVKVPIESIPILSYSSQGNDRGAGRSHSRTPATAKAFDAQSLLGLKWRLSKCASQGGYNALIRSGGLADRTTLFRNDLAFAADPSFPKNPHTFLTNIAGSPSVTAVAVGTQTQIAVFFASNGGLTIDPDGPGPLFEVPIIGPVPEDLAFIP